MINEGKCYNCKIQYSDKTKIFKNMTFCGLDIEWRTKLIPITFERRNTSLEITVLALNHTSRWVHMPFHNENSIYCFQLCKFHTYTPTISTYTAHYRVLSFFLTRQFRRINVCSMYILTHCSALCEHMALRLEFEQDIFLILRCLSHWLCTSENLIMKPMHNHWYCVRLENFL